MTLLCATSAAVPRPCIPSTTSPGFSRRLGAGKVGFPPISSSSIRWTQPHLRSGARSSRCPVQLSAFPRKLSGGDDGLPPYGSGGGGGGGGGGDEDVGRTDGDGDSVNWTEHLLLMLWNICENLKIPNLLALLHAVLHGFYGPTNPARAEPTHFDGNDAPRPVLNNFTDIENQVNNHSNRVPGTGSGRVASSEYASSYHKDYNRRKDNLHNPSSDSSNSMPAINLMGADATHSNGNKNEQNDDQSYRIDQNLLDNHVNGDHALVGVTTTSSPINSSVVDTSKDAYDFDKDENKDQLLFAYPLTQNMVGCCIFNSLACSVALAYASKTAQSNEGTPIWILGGSGLSGSVSWVLSGYFSKFKEGKSIDQVKFEICIVVLLVVVLFNSVVFLMTLHIYLRTSILVVSIIGTAIFFAALFIWIKELNLLKILQNGMKASLLPIGMLSDRPAASLTRPQSADYLLTPYECLICTGCISVETKLNEETSFHPAA